MFIVEAFGALINSAHEATSRLAYAIQEGLRTEVHILAEMRSVAGGLDSFYAAIILHVVEEPSSFPYMRRTRGAEWSEHAKRARPARRHRSLDLVYPAEATIADSRGPGL